MITITKTREGATVTSKKAGTIIFDTSNIPQDTISGSVPIGTASAEQLEIGVNYPNTQSAIQEMATIFQHRINEVVTLVEDATNPTQSPEGVNMVIRMDIDGIANESRAIKVFGIPVILSRGDNRAKITDKIIAELNKHQDNKVAFKDITKTSGESSKIDVTFIDTLNHGLFQLNDNGVKITSIVITNPIAGYGTWEYLGSSNVTSPHTPNATIKLKYYKRIA